MTRASGRPRTAGIALLSVLAALLLGGWPSAVAARPAPTAAIAVSEAAPAQQQPPDRRLRLDVVALDGLVDVDNDLRLRGRVANAGRGQRDDVRIVATVHAQTRSRWQHEQAVEEGALGHILHAFSMDLAPIPGGGARTVEFAESVDDLGLAGRIGQGGVYPLRVQLLHRGEVVDEVITSLVLLPSVVEEPLRVAVVVPLAAPPGRRADGAFVEAGLAGDVAPTGDLGRTVAALLARPDVPVTLAVDGLLLEEVADLAGGFVAVVDGRATAYPADSRPARDAEAFLERVSDVAGRRDVETVALPYASADVVALVRSGQSSEAVRALTDGARTVERLAGTRASTRLLWPPDGLDDDSLTRLRRAKVDTLILAEEHLRAASDGNLTPSPVRRLRSGATRMDVAVPDPWIAEALAGHADGDAVAAQRLLAEVAGAYFERPGRADRGLLLAPTAPMTVDRRLAALVEALADAPFVEPVTVSGLVRHVDAEPDPVRLDYSSRRRRQELPSSYLSALAAARRALGSLEAALVDDPATPARFDRLLLQAASVHYRRSGTLDDGRELLRSVATTVEGIYGAVSVPQTPPVTLTSVEGRLPVTLRSTADMPLRLRVELRSPRYEFEDGAAREVVVQPGESRIITVGVRALAPGGTSPVQVVVSDPDGAVQLASGAVIVRSTAFSVVGVLATAAAALFLLGWGVREAVRRRRTPGATTVTEELLKEPRR